jgi:hypothetical protein
VCVWRGLGRPVRRWSCRRRRSIGSGAKRAQREQSSLSDGQADPRAWLDHGERVQGRCLQLASAYYCLHGWLEPDGAEPDTKALRGWSHAFATGTVQPGQRNQVGLANRLRQLLGASHG